MNQAQANILNSKLAMLDRFKEAEWQTVDPYAPPMNSRPFIVTPAPFPGYPAPGAVATEIIRYVVPVGQVAVINYLAVVHVGGGFVDGSGNVIWRILRNSAALKGMNNLQSQVGTYAAPIPVAVMGVEGDIFTVTVEVPAAQPPMPPGSSTAARIHGFIMPVVTR